MHVEGKRLHCRVLLRLNLTRLNAAGEGGGRGRRGNDKGEEESASTLGEKIICKVL